MKFWELESIFSDEKRVMEQILRGPPWKQYLQWHNCFAEHVHAQNRSILDARAPDELCREMLAKSCKRYVATNGQLTSFMPCDAEVGRAMLSAVEAFDLYGGTALEEVSEKGSYVITK